MPAASRLDLLRWICIAAASGGLAGCASMPRHTGGARPSSPPAMGTAFSSGSACYAPPPDLQAAYNQPYEINGQWYHPLSSDAGYDRRGIASWYDTGSSSTVTAMGTAFHDRQLNAASRTLPLPSCVRVTNLQNGRSVLLLVDDRGPFVAGRILDLSVGAAHALGMVAQGTTPVRIQAIPPQNAVPPVRLVQTVRHVSPAAPVLEPVSARPVPSVPVLPPAGDSGTPLRAARARLQAVVDRTFGTSGTPSPAGAPQTPRPAAPLRPRPERLQYASAPAVPPPRLRPAVYLVTASPMDLHRALHEKHKLQAFGITTAHLVTANGGGYAVKIGPLAGSSSTRVYVRSLQRLELGEFQVAPEGHGRAE